MTLCSRWSPARAIAGHPCRSWGGTLMRAIGATIVASALLAPGASADVPITNDGIPAQYVTATPPPDPTDHEAPIRLLPLDGGTAAASHRNSASPFVAINPTRYVISVPGGTWATARNAISGYVLGELANGWTFDAVDRTTDFSWYEGYAYGDYQQCAWVLAQNLNSKTGTAASLCPSGVNWSMDPSTFATGFNCSGCGTGEAVNLVANATEWAEVRPWNVPASGPYDALRGANATQCVEWRYVSKDGNWVMAKDRSVADTAGSWVFIPRSAFPATLPTGSASCP